MTNQEELQRMISGLTDDDAAQALDYISWLAAEAETLNDPDLAAMYHGEEEIARGEFVTLEDLTQVLGA